MESHLEARLWNDVFILAQDELGMPRGTIKATVLIETILAAFEMDEILYELRDHSAGLNCGRWDYIFSVIKKRRNDPAFILPDRAQVTMTTHFMRSYSLLLIKTCHRRGAHAMGGMAAYIPIKTDPRPTSARSPQVRADKEREATDGHDGTWVAHPGLVAVAREVFDAACRSPTRSTARARTSTSPPPTCSRSPRADHRGGLRANIRIGVQYLEAWLGGIGCVPLYNLMEDAATAEISRAQVWQWIRHPRGILTDGRKVTVELYRQLQDEEMEKILAAAGDLSGRHFDEAAKLFESITTSDVFVDFLTLPAYAQLP